jgi:pimeloyl-ACP methyl ester carboxylesterase
MTPNLPDEPETRARTKWERLDGRRVRLRVLLPRDAARGAWPEPTTHPPLLLLHGLGCSAEAWAPTLSELAHRGGLDRPAYAVDLPGFGRSGGPRRALGVAQLADWTVRLMDILGIPRAHLAGNSLGCQVALALARRHPGRAASLVLAGASTGGDLVSLPAMALGLLWDGLIEPGFWDGSLPRMYLQAGPRRYLETVARMRADHPVLLAGAVVAPCLVVRGDRDAAVPERAARALADALPGGAFLSVEGSPHAVPYAAPSAFTDLMIDFCGIGGGIEGAGRPANRGIGSAREAGGPSARRRRRDGRVWVDGRPVRYGSVSPSSASSTSRALLLLHGLAGSGEVWGRLLPILGRCLSGSSLPSAVYAPDLPGCGRSPGPRRALSIDELADWCARFLDAVGLQSERVDLGAHSMGCQVALALACRHPGRVGRLVLVGPTTGGRSVPLWRYLAGMMVGSSREPLVYRLLAVRMFWRMGLGRYVGAVCEMMKDDALCRATGVAASCLVLRGGRDAIIPEFAARSLAAALPVGSYLPVGTAGHVVPFNSAVDLAPLALAFWEHEPDRGLCSKDGGSSGPHSSRIGAAEATSGTSGTGR